MVPIPTVKGGLHLASRDGGHDGPGGLGVVCLAWGVFVEGREVHYSPRCPVMFGSDDHAAAPLHRLIDRHPLKDAKLHVPVQASLDLVTPVDGDLAGCVDSHRSGRLISEEAEGRTVIHELEGLVFTAVEAAGRVPLEDVLLELLHVLRGGGAGQYGWGGGRHLTAGARAGRVSLCGYT